MFPPAVRKRFSVNSNNNDDGEVGNGAGAAAGAAGEAAQAGILIKCIKSFLNDLDLDHLDPDNVRVVGELSELCVCLCCPLFACVYLHVFAC